MHVEFRKAVIPDEIPKLRAFDKKVFPKADLFSTREWREYESYWMIVDGTAVGCCAFQPNVDFREDKDDSNPPLKGSLYVTTTGILPDSQSTGLGRMLKCWQIAYAKYHGFNRIVTNNRKRNAKIISLNREFGFHIVRTTSGYYSDPNDATVVMERRLNRPRRDRKG
jgi:ribosomal protein S18 acetylase RimI-like enzyme